MNPTGNEMPQVRHITSIDSDGHLISEALCGYRWRSQSNVCVTSKNPDDGFEICRECKQIEQSRAVDCSLTSEIKARLDAASSPPRSEMSKHDLKPCPFCKDDGDPQLDTSEFPIVSCITCGFSGEKWEDEDTAVSAWNSLSVDLPDLKPCPLCGQDGSPILANCGGRPAVWCTECGICPSGSLTEREAVDRWNHRSPSDQLRQKDLELQAAREEIKAGNLYLSVTLEALEVARAEVEKARSERDKLDFDWSQWSWVRRRRVKKQGLR